MNKTVADTGGLQWFQLKPPLKIARAPNLLTIHRVGDKTPRVIYSVLWKDSLLANNFIL